MKIVKNSVVLSALVVLLTTFAKASETLAVESQVFVFPAQHYIMPADRIGSAVAGALAVDPVANQQDACDHG